MSTQKFNLFDRVIALVNKGSVMVGCNGTIINTYSYYPTIYYIVRFFDENNVTKEVLEMTETEIKLVK